MVERLSPAAEAALLELDDADRTAVTDCIKYIREKPEPDGRVIFDVPLYPAMFRSMKCGAFLITFRMQNGDARIYAIVEDDG